ncbi:MAG: hypothetical protein PUC01_04165, partial [Spirochaetales bacterium]|nr:hypothetical protein [Spirochaetales bacterium]
VFGRLSLNPFNTNGSIIIISPIAIIYLKIIFYSTSIKNMLKNITQKALLNVYLRFCILK